VIECSGPGHRHPFGRHPVQPHRLIFHCVIPHGDKIDGLVNQPFVRQVVPAGHAQGVGMPSARGTADVIHLWRSGFDQGRDDQNIGLACLMKASVAVSVGMAASRARSVDESAARPIDVARSPRSVCRATHGGASRRARARSLGACRYSRRQVAQVVAAQTDVASQSPHPSLRIGASP
jgi:hypothetical protein